MDFYSSILNQKAETQNQKKKKNSLSVSIEMVAFKFLLSKLDWKTT